LFDADIAITGAFGFDVAQRGEALFQRPAGSNGGASGAQGERRIQYVDIVSACAGSSPCKKMWVCESMRPGSRVAADNRSRWLRRNFGVGRIGNTLDAIAVDDDDLVVPRLIGLAIDQRAGANNGKRFGARLSVCCCCPRAEITRARSTIHAWVFTVGSSSVYGSVNDIPVNDSQLTIFS